MFHTKAPMKQIILSINFQLGNVKLDLQSLLLLVSLFSLALLHSALAHFLFPLDQQSPISGYHHRFGSSKKMPQMFCQGELCCRFFFRGLEDLGGEMKLLLLKTNKNDPPKQ